MIVVVRQVLAFGSFGVAGDARDLSSNLFPAK